MNHPLLNNPSDVTLRSCPIDQLADDVPVHALWVADAVTNRWRDDPPEQVNSELHVIFDWAGRLQAEAHRLTLLWRLDQARDHQVAALLAKAEDFKRVCNALIREFSEQGGPDGFHVGAVAAFKPRPGADE